MYGYTVWPGAYSFKEEIGLFIAFVKQQVDDLIEKIEQTEEAIDAVQLFDQGMGGETIRLLLVTSRIAVMKFICVTQSRTERSAFNFRTPNGYCF